MISFKQLFYESKSIESDLIKSIKNRNAIYFYYEGDNKIARGYRWVQPVAYGLSKDGNGLLRAYQIKDTPSKSKSGEGWRLFRTDKIFDISNSLRKFNKPRKGYNKHGDKSMHKLIINAKFK